MITVYKRNISFIQNDIFQILSLYLLTILVVYFLPGQFKNIYFFIIAILFFKSKRNYFWIAFIIMLLDPPGGLFNEQSQMFALPTFNLGSGEKYLKFSELFIIIVFLKTFRIQSKNNFFFQRPLVVLFIYMVFLFVISFAMGFPVNRVLNILRHILPFSLFISIPKLLKTEQDYKRLFSLLFAFVFLLFFAQSYDFIFKSKVAFLLGETSVPTGFGQIVYSGDTIKSTHFTIRVLYGPFIILLSFIISMFYLLKKEKYFNSNYLYIVNTIALLSIILSATRGWIISLFFMYMIFIFLVSKNPLKLFTRLLIAFFVVFTLVNLSPGIKLQLENSITRFETVFALLEGDLSAEGTLARLNIRSPRVMNKFYQHPIIGVAYSKDFFEYSDGHVGNQTLLLNGGIVGFLLFLNLFFLFSLKLFKRNKSLSRGNPYSTSLLIFIIGLAGIIIIHSSSVMIFWFGINVKIGLILTLFFCFSDIVYKKSIQTELALILKQDKIK